jgi:hypothetical protein
LRAAADDCPAQNTAKTSTVTARKTIRVARFFSGAFDIFIIFIKLEMLDAHMTSHLPA